MAGSSVTALREIVLAERGMALRIGWDGEMTDLFHASEPVLALCRIDGNAGIARAMLRPFARRLTVSLHVTGTSLYSLDVV
ncbi:MAG: hypothetical protein JOZ01_09965, partial [Candidatus Eremiobacteraeota bacterium]|nr:hypothetical protein [Candidatus Eremiobacteraeota bacterium]